MIVRDLMACFGSLGHACCPSVWLIVAVAVIIDESVRERWKIRKSRWGRAKHGVVALAKRVDEPGNLLFWSCSSSS